MMEFEKYIKQMVDKGFNKVELNDDNPNITSKKFSEISDIMKRNGVEDWMSFVNPVITCKTKNLKRVIMGAECFNDTIFEKINKKQTVSQIIQSIDFYISNDVDVFCNMIIGLPGETDQEFEKSFKVMEYLKNKYGEKLTYWPTTFRVFPGSYMYHNPEKFGISYSYWENTDLPKQYFVEGINKDKVNKRMELIFKTFPVKIFYEISDKKILYKR